MVGFALNIAIILLATLAMLAVSWLLYWTRPILLGTIDQIFFIVNGILPQNHGIQLNLYQKTVQEMFTQLILTQKMEKFMLFGKILQITKEMVMMKTFCFLKGFLMELGRQLK